MVEAISLAATTALISAFVTWYGLRKFLEKKVRLQQLDRKDRLHGLIESTVGTTGETYFYALVRELSQFLSVDSVFLAACIDDELQSYQTPGLLV